MSKSLLNRLYRLTASEMRREEDFFTEIVAELLREDLDLLNGWIQGYMPDRVSRLQSAQVSTQVEYERIRSDGPDRRPDLRVEAECEAGERLTVLIESKLGSAEHEAQLPDYAAALAQNHPESDVRLLLYVTRDYDPKDEGRILKGLESVAFSQGRWTDFYRLLLPRLETSPTMFLAREVKSFMEERRLAMSDRFTPADLAALTQFSNALAIMYEAISGPVNDRFNEVLNGGGSQRTTWLTQLHDKGRYAVYRFGNSVDYYLGFRMDGEDGYPLAFVDIEVSGGYRDADLFEDLLVVARGSDVWKQRPDFSLVAREKWAGLRISRSLADLVGGGASHIDVLREFFLGALDEVERLQTSHPQWFREGREDSPPADPE